MAGQNRHVCHLPALVLASHSQPPHRHARGYLACGSTKAMLSTSCHDGRHHSTSCHDGRHHSTSLRRCMRSTAQQASYRPQDYRRASTHTALLAVVHFLTHATLSSWIGCLDVRFSKVLRGRCMDLTHARMATQWAIGLEPHWSPTIMTTRC